LTPRKIDFVDEQLQPCDSLKPIADLANKSWWKSKEKILARDLRIKEKPVKISGSIPAAKLDRPRNKALPVQSLALSQHGQIKIITTTTTVKANG